jgi:photosystem II stability/assembly factor-like uncharacterized protein
MKKLLLLALLIILNFSLITSYSHTQWIKQNWPVFESVYGVSFFDSNTGLVAMKMWTGGYYALYKTTNAGFNWVENYRPLGWIYLIQKLDDTTIYMLGDNGSQYIMYKSFNRGISWDSLNFISLRGMYFISRDTGWTAMFDGYYQRYYFTTNGGNSFSLLYSHLSSGYETEMFFLKEKYNGNFVGYRTVYDLIKKTTDGGYNWIDLPPLPIVQEFDKNGIFLTPPDVTQIAFINKDTGWVSNGTKNIYKTTNGGNNWILQHIPNEPHLNNSFSAFYGVKIINKDTLYAQGGAYSFSGSNYKGVIFKTTNGGGTWGYQMPDTSFGMFYGLGDFINSNTGWFTNIHTTNGGGPIIYTEIKNVTVEQPEKFQLFQNYPNPFNPSTTIDFYLPEKSIVKLEIYDITGKTIFKIIDNFQLQPGYHSYKIDEFNSLGISTGTYFYKLSAHNISSQIVYTTTKRMLYIK